GTGNASSLCNFNRHRATRLSDKRFRFILRNLMYLRNFQGLVEVLAATGHEVAITTSPHDLKIPDELRQLARNLEHPYRGISFGLTHERADWWAPSSRLLRNIANLLHYRRPEYRNAPALTARAERRAGLVPRLLFPRALCSLPNVARTLRAAL